MPELIVQKRTGHKSLDALYTYERITPIQEQQVAQILSDPTMVSYTTPQEHANDIIISEEEFSVTPEENFWENIPMHASMMNNYLSGYVATVQLSFSSEFLWPKFSSSQFL